MNKVKEVVVIGGGTAGWITTGIISKLVGKAVNVTVIESDSIPTVGVGEATIPPIIHLNNALGIKEQDFLRETNGTIKLGIEFQNWKTSSSAYMHAFGDIGKNFPFCDFHHFWNRGAQSGKSHSLWDYSLNYQAAKSGKFEHVKNIPGTDLAGIAYAYHFDAGLYAEFLKKLCLQIGAKRIEGTVETINQCETTGNITDVVLQSGEQIKGDLFIDCTGMRALLAEGVLNTGYEDWSHWLPCDRAIAVQSDKHTDQVPYTKSIAFESGWRWEIPLQHRMGNGVVYSSKHISDDEAKAHILNSIQGEPITEPRVIRFKPGRRLKQWNKNVISIGLSSGFLEPLESTSIHLIQSAAIRLVKLFPHQGITDEIVTEYNRQSKSEFEQIRDFIICHYKVTQREDSPFWRHVKRMDIPETLSAKIELFKKNGYVFRTQDELFSEIAWIQVLIGQGCLPEDFHPLASNLSDEQLADLFSTLKVLVDGTVNKMKSYEGFLQSIPKK